MSSAPLLSLAGALVLAAVHVLSPKLRVLDGVPRSRLLSIAGGMAVAFVVLRLLPAIAEHQYTLEAASRGGGLRFLRNHAYIVVLFSVVLFYGLERAAKKSRRTMQARGAEGRARYWIFWIHTGTFALVNLLIGYLLVSHVERDVGTRFVVLFTLAMLFKFIVNDHGLHHDHKELYDRVGRWVLAAAVLLGWGTSHVTDIPRVGPALLQAFIGGAVLLNVLKEELPEARESRYWAFALGAVLYSVLLLSF